MTCPSCIKAESDPTTGLFHIGCPECQARQLAHGFAFHVWKARGGKDGTYPKEYVKAVKRIAKPGETPEQAHARVKAWANRIATQPPATSE